MNILSVNFQDLAGLSYNLCTAINTLTDHHAVNVVLSSTWLRYPMMVAGKKEAALQVPKLLSDADVVHINEFPNLLSSMGCKPEDCNGKQIIYHAHGSKFRRRYPKYLKALYANFPQAKVIVSTPDLAMHVPKASWFPAVVPIEKYHKEHTPPRNDPPILYNSATKPKRHRPILVKATDELRKEGLQFETKFVYGVRHIENLRRKALADIYLNSIKPFYGVDALEASAFEMPVITGMNEFSRQYIADHDVNCSYILANNINLLKDRLRLLVEDADLRMREGQRSYEFARKHHSEEVCVKRFMELIE